MTPVKGAKEAIAADADPDVAALAESPLIFPPDDVLANVKIFKTPDRGGRDLLQRQVLGRHRQLAEPAEITRDR